MINLNPLLPDNNLEFSLQKVKDVLSPNVTSSQTETLKYHQENSEALKESCCTPKTRKKMSEVTKRKWGNPETRQKMSEASKRKWGNPEIRQKMSEAMKGCRRTPEAKQRISEALKSRRITPETRQKMSEALKGNRHTLETRQRISEALKGRRITLETRKRISEVLKGNRHTLETRQRISEAAKRRWRNPETREKMSEAAKRRWRNPETRQKMSEALKGHRRTLETRQRISEVKKRVLAMPEARQKMSEAAKRVWGNPETKEKILEARKLSRRNIIQLSRQRAEEAIASVLAQTQEQKIKIEPQDILPEGDHEVQMTDSLKRIHKINNRLPILQDPNDPTHSLFSKVEGAVDQIKISRYGDLELSSTQKKQMLEEVKEWIRVNENDKEAYRQKLEELFEISVPIEIGPDRGRSVYAKRNIRKFEVVGPYAGLLQRSEKELRQSIRQKGSYNVLSYLFSTRSKYRAVDGFSNGNTTSLINTGQLPGKPIWNENNLTTIQVGKNINFYVAQRDICQGEELLIDYGPNYNPMCFLKVEREDHEK